MGAETAEAMAFRLREKIESALANFLHWKAIGREDFAEKSRTAAEFWTLTLRDSFALLRRPSAAARNHAHAAYRTLFFWPGRIVPSFGSSFDKVLAYRPHAGRASSMGWAVEVVECLRSGEWLDGAPIRKHATEPNPKELEAFLRRAIDNHAEEIARAYVGEASPISPAAIILNDEPLPYVTPEEEAL